MARSEMLTEEDRAWLCSGSSFAKTKKPELTVMATSNVEIMLHNLRYEIHDLESKLSEVMFFLSSEQRDYLIKKWSEDQ